MNNKGYVLAEAVPVGDATDLAGLPYDLTGEDARTAFANLRPENPVSGTTVVECVSIVYVLRKLFGS